MARHLYVRHDGLVLAAVENQPGARMFIAWTDEQAMEWWIDFENERLPELGEDDPGHAISDEGLDILVGHCRPGDTGEMEAIMPDGEESDDEADDVLPIGYTLGEKGRRFIRCCHPVTGFREFLRVWQFLDQDTGKLKLLGEVLWPGQEHYVVVCRESAWIYYLKARQLGETTIAIAYDAYVMRFRTTNARVHLVARIEEDAKNDLLKPLVAGLKALPEEMALPTTQATTTVFIMDGGPGDRRAAYAYPAKEPGRGKSCSHLHLDEWAAMMKTSPELPKDVWAAAEPTISKHGGTCHILTTGVGPEGFYADVWRKCVEGEGQLVASFIKAAGSRPEYTPEWLAAKRRAMSDDAKFRREYPDTWQDALSGAGDTFFTTYEIDHAAEYARGLAQVGLERERGQAMHRDRRTGRLRRRKYVKAWDIGGPGEKSDETIGTVLDVTESVWDVVEQIVLQGEEYPIQAYHIEQIHKKWRGFTVLEDNAAGGAVRSFLKISEEDLRGFTTTKQSKPTIIGGLKHGLQAQVIKWNPDECPKLDTQMRIYKTADESLKQDTVMSLAIAVEYGAEAAEEAGGRVLNTITV